MHLKAKPLYIETCIWTKNRTKNRPGNDLKIRPLLLKIKPGIGLKIGDIGLKIAAFLCGAFKFV